MAANIARGERGWPLDEGLSARQRSPGAARLTGLKRARRGSSEDFELSCRAVRLEPLLSVAAVRAVHAAFASARAVLCQEAARLTYFSCELGTTCSRVFGAALAANALAAIPLFPEQRAPLLQAVM